MNCVSNKKRGSLWIIFSRRILLGALTMLILNSCNLPAQTPHPVGTILPSGQPTTTLPTGTLNNITPTAVIPVTGMDAISLQCQFCVNDETHAVLVLNERASFNVSDPATRVTCLTAQVINGQRILLCRGASQVSFNLNVCVDNSNCQQFPVMLQTCPFNPQAGIGSPAPTLIAPPPATATRIPVQTSTSVPTFAPLPTSTIVPPIQPTSTPAPVLQPTATTLPTQQSGLGVHVAQSPEGFVRWYFEAVWKTRNYQDLWDNYLTPNFKNKVGSGIYQDYVAWWDSVERVDVNSVDVLKSDSAHAWVRVNITFYMKDGRIIKNQEYQYDLLYDANRRTWMFD